MRNYLFKGMREDTREWVEGHYYTQVFLEDTIEEEWYHFIKPIGSKSWQERKVIPKSVGEYTGMNEFVLTDETRNAKLFEGDIVEVWGWRTVCGRNQSQYDKRVKVRGVIRFEYGEWKIDYNNNYNRSLAVLKGNEVQEREVSGATRLYYYGYHGSDIEGYRKEQLEWHGKFHNIDEIIGHDDIKRIGTVFENSELLEEEI